VLLLQLDYLRENLTGRWGDKVMTRVSGILRHVPAGSSHPDCLFPQLAGSHLSQVRPRWAGGSC
jgi:hypothetical protein